MSDLRKAAEMALARLEYTIAYSNEEMKKIDEAKNALRQALAEDALQELADIDHSLGLFIDKPPVKSYCGGKPNYCTEPEDWVKREWVGLTDDEAWACWNWEDFNETWKKMEAKLKEKNT